MNSGEARYIGCVDNMQPGHIRILVNDNCDLWCAMIVREWKPGGYVSLPDACTLHAAEVYGDGSATKVAK